MKVLSKIINSMEKVMLEKEPCFECKQGSAFQGEKKFFQLSYFLVEQDNQMFNQIKASGKIAERVKIENIQFAMGTVLPDCEDDYYISKSTGLYPDIVKPFGEINLTLVHAQWRAVWVTVDTSDLTVGKYDIFFTLFDSKGIVANKLKYTLEIIGRKLEKTDLMLTCWIHYDCIAKWHNVELFTETFYNLFEKYLDAYVEIGHNMLLTPLFTPPLDTMVYGERLTAQLIKIKVEKGKYTFNFEELIKFLNFALGRGIKFIEFSHLFTQWGAKACPKIMATVDGEYKRIFGWEDSSINDKYTYFLSEFLPQLVKVIENLGIKDRCFFHLSDEPNGDMLDCYEKARKTVKKYIGNIKIIDALSEYEFYKRGIIDIPIPAIHAAKNFFARGVENLMVYYCSPESDYYSNRILNMPLQRTRILGFQLYETGVKGFLHWGFNFYNTFYSISSIDPYTDTSSGGRLFSGDSFIVYPQKDGVYMSERAYAMEEAFNDYRALKTLEKYIGREKSVEFLHKEGIFGFNKYPRSAEIHNEIREKINSMIGNLMSQG